MQSTSKKASLSRTQKEIEENKNGRKWNQSASKPCTSRFCPSYTLGSPSTPHFCTHISTLPRPHLNNTNLPHKTFPRLLTPYFIHNTCATLRRYIAIINAPPIRRVRLSLRLLLLLLTTSIPQHLLRLLRISAPHAAGDIRMPPRPV